MLLNIDGGEGQTVHAYRPQPTSQNTAWPVLPQDEVSPGPSLKERGLEVSAALLTGLVHISDLLQPSWIFIVVCALFWISWGVYQHRTYGSSVMRGWGLRWDQPHLKKNMIRASQVAVVLVITLVIACIIFGKPIVMDNWHMWLLFVIYPPFGVLQQFLIQAILTRNLNFLFIGSDERTVLEKAGLLGWVQVMVCTMVPAGAFSLVHYPHCAPDGGLMAATGLLGLLWAPLYLKDRNLLPLGLYHGWVGTLFYFWFLQGDPIQRITSGAPPPSYGGCIV